MTFKRYIRQIYSIAGVRRGNAEDIKDEQYVTLSIDKIETDSDRRQMQSEQFLTKVEEFKKFILEDAGLTPPGKDNYIIFNDNGEFGASKSLQYNDITGNFELGREFFGAVPASLDKQASVLIYGRGNIDEGALLFLNTEDDIRSAISLSDKGFFFESNVLDVEQKSLDGTSLPSGVSRLIADADDGGKLKLITDSGATTYDLTAIGSPGTGEANTGSNLGDTNVNASVFRGKNGVDFEYRTLKEGSDISITEDANEITIGLDGTLGEVNTNENLSGGDAQIFKEKNGVTMFLRSLKEAGPIQISQDANNIIIDSDAEVNQAASKAGQSGSVDVFDGKNGEVLEFLPIKGTGDTTVTRDGDTIIVNSTSSGGGSAFVQVDSDIQNFVQTIGGNASLTASVNLQNTSGGPLLLSISYEYSNKATTSSPPLVDLNCIAEIRINGSLVYSGARLSVIRQVFNENADSGTYYQVSNTGETYNIELTIKNRVAIGYEIGNINLYASLR